MKIRRFFGNNIRSALRQVNEEFGSEAAILSNNKVPGGVEVIAAIDYDESLMPETQLQLEPNLKDEVAYSQEAHDFKTPTESDSPNEISNILSEQERPQNAINLKGSLDLSKSSNGNDSLQTLDKATISKRENGAITVDEIKSHFARNAAERKAHSNTSLDKNHRSFAHYENSDLSDQKAQNERKYNNQNTDDKLQAKMQQGYAATEVNDKNVIQQAVNRTEKKLEWSLDPSLQAMREELGLMRAMMKEQLKGLSWQRYSEHSPVSAMILRRLSSIGIDSEMLDSILPHIKHDADAECAWQHVLALLAKSIPTQESELLRDGGIYALVGGTGVGKTTTIAKLAARYVIKHGSESVGLISADSYRIAAQDQLASFGRLLKIETAKVTVKQSLEKLLAQFSHKKLVLIDTAGMQESDSQLTTQLDALDHFDQSINKLLVLPATNQGAVNQAAINFFGAHMPSGIIVSKLDEAASLGELISVIVKSNIPVVYTTDGQRVPEDIRVARSHHLVSKAVWLSSKNNVVTDDWKIAQEIPQQRIA